VNKSKIARQADGSEGAAKGQEHKRT
jgi:hypothetical protein